MQVLLTNDDGIEAEGLQALRRALVQLPGVELAVIAPDGNRSAFARMITTRRPLWVQEVALRGRHERLRHRRHAGRLRAPGQARPRSRASTPTSWSRASTTAPTWATTSPTRARSPPRSRRSSSGSRASPSPSSPTRARWTSAWAAASTSSAPRTSSRAWSPSSTRCRCPQGTLLNINVPAGEPDGVQVTRLGKRIYRDELKLDAEDEDGGRRYWIYGADPGFHDEPGTDLAAVHARPHRGHARALRPHRRLGPRRADQVRPGAAARPGRPRGAVSSPEADRRARRAAARGAHRARPALLRARRPDHHRRPVRPAARRAARHRGRAPRAAHPRLARRSASAASRSRR